MERSMVAESCTGSFPDCQKPNNPILPYRQRGRASPRRTASLARATELRTSTASTDVPALEAHDARVHSSERLSGRLRDIGLTIALGSAFSLCLTSLPAIATEHDTLFPTHHPVSADLMDISQGEDFWSNLASYGRYFITVLLGTAYTAVKPVGRLLRNPVTAALLIAGLIGGYFFLNATLKAMLGVGQEPFSLSDI